MSFYKPPATEVPLQGLLGGPGTEIDRTRRPGFSRSDLNIRACGRAWRWGWNVDSLQKYASRIGNREHSWEEMHFSAIQAGAPGMRSIWPGMSAGVLIAPPRLHTSSRIDRHGYNNVDLVGPAAED